MIIFTRLVSLGLISLSIFSYYATTKGKTAYSFLSSPFIVAITASKKFKNINNNDNFFDYIDMRITKILTVKMFYQEYQVGPFDPTLDIGCAAYMKKASKGRSLG